MFNLFLFFKEAIKWTLPFSVRLVSRGSGTTGPCTITLAVALWILYDSQRKYKEAILWRIVTVVAAIFVIPSLVLAVDGRFSASPLALKMLNAVDFLPYLGILGGLAALLALIGYVGGWGVEEGVGYEAVEPIPQTVPAPPPPSPMPPPATEHAAAPAPPFQPAAPAPAPTEILRKKPLQMAWFVVRSGPRAGKEFQLGEITNIGRDAMQNDIALDDSAMSRQHAKVKLEDGQFVLYDLASTNGTFVNGERIYRHVLADGDRITIGETEFIFMEVKEKEE